MEEGRHECSMNKEAFMRNAYHNMRNPIVVIKGYTSLMLEGCGGELSEDQKEWITDMKVNTEYLLTLINNLAELSYVEAGIAAKEKSPVSLLEIVERVRNNLSGIQGDRKISINTGAPPPVMSADDSLIGSAFTRLIHNALIYTPEGGTVSIELGEEGDRVRFSVSDAGPGIPRENQRAIMEGFFRGAESGEYRGTGLGILIARRIAEFYGGSLTIESAPEKGSTFTIIMEKNGA